MQHNSQIHYLRIRSTIFVSFYCETNLQSGVGSPAKASRGTSPSSLSTHCISLFLPFTHYISLFSPFTHCISLFPHPLTASHSSLDATTATGSSCPPFQRLKHEDDNFCAIAAVTKVKARYLGASLGCTTKRQVSLCFV